MKSHELQKLSAQLCGSNKKKKLFQFLFQFKFILLRADFIKMVEVDFIKLSQEGPSC